jgi:hypothetical protein
VAVRVTHNEASGGFFDRPRRREAAGVISGLSVINELITDGEKALHPTDRFGDYAERLSGLKLVL